jgi:hypothetical protein
MAVQGPSSLELIEVKGKEFVSLPVFNIVLRKIV